MKDVLVDELTNGRPVLECVAFVQHGLQTAKLRLNNGFMKKAGQLERLIFLNSKGWL